MKCGRQLLRTQKLQNSGYLWEGREGREQDEEGAQRGLLDSVIFYLFTLKKKKDQKQNGKKQITKEHKKITVHLLNARYYFKYFTWIHHLSL